MKAFTPMQGRKVHIPSGAPPMIPVILLLFFLTGGCSLYNDYNLKGKYRLAGGEYYDGRMYPLEDFEGSLNLEITTYTVNYTISFTRKDSSAVSESREESGRFNYTTEYETAVFGTEGKVFSGYIFFTPSEESGEPWNMEYEYYKKDKVLTLDNYRYASQLGYYVILRWEEVK